MRGEHRQTSGYPQDPPGDELVEQVLEGEEKQEALRRAAALPRLMVDREAEITLEMIATGVFSPITGFLPRVENESVLEEGRLTDGTPWPIPLSMAPTGRRNREVLAGLAGGEEIALVNQRGETVALLEVEDIYEYDREHRVIINALRTNYVFAGPREAVLHAIVMRNYGCTHAVIGRDHAGVGDIYDLYVGQRVFQEYTESELGIKPMFFLEVFYCTRCRATATERTCPHDSRYRMQISGTGIREILRRGYLPPKEICRPEVAHVAIQGVVPQGTDEEGRSIYPVGQTMHSLFPFYEVSTRLGGYLRREIVEPGTMGERDLEAALLDARTHADSIYADTFAEVAAAAEVNRSLAERWRTEARDILVDHQAEVVSQLEGKMARVAAGEGEPTGETTEDVEEELRVARDILSRHPRPLHQDQACVRIISEELYDSYRPDSESRPDSETDEETVSGEDTQTGEDSES